MPRKERTYNLFTRCLPGNEPKIAVAVDAYTPGTDHVEGTETTYVPRYGANRGALIYTTNTYKKLVGHAEYLAKMMGMPKSRIWDIFDWNEGLER